MKSQTLEKKIKILEQAVAWSAGAYYSINLTKNIALETMYQVVDNQEYSVNEQIGFPVNARFSDVITYWGEKVAKEDRAAYDSFFDISNLLEHYKNGERHLIHTYRTKTVLDSPMYAEQHIIMYADEENGDVLGITYLRDLTEQTETSQKLVTERQFLNVICRDYTSVYYIDLKNDIMEPLKMELNENAAQISRIRPRKKVGYTEAIAIYCERYVTEANKEEFLNVMQREKLLQELSKAERFIYRYESVPNKAGHHYFEVQLVRISEEVFDGNIIAAFRHIDDMVDMEQRYRRQLEELAYLDILTKLGNRAAFTKELAACEENPKVACVVADVNNLKLCNDMYGHQEGDKVIIDAAECVCKAFEELGKCYRIGGDEFGVLLPECEEQEIWKALERLEGLITEKNKQRVMPLSIACGYAIRENMDESLEQLFNKGDEMMYDVKYRMKKEFPVYREERIQNYLNVLKNLSKSTDDYLFLWDIAKDEFWFFDEVDRNYTLRDKGNPMISMAELKKIIYPADWKRLCGDLGKIATGTKRVHNMNYRWMNRQREIVWINGRGTVINDDKGRPFVMIGRVSDKLLKHLYHPMTKLFNKNKLLRDLKEEFMNKNAGYFMLTVIDNLGDINLKHGRRYGDGVIKECAKIIEKSEMSQYVWHVENNCFVLYLDVRTEEEVYEVYDGLQRELSEVCSISAGIVPNSRAMFEDEHNLYGCAELTLEKAKSMGRQTITFFSQEDMEERKKTVQFLEEMQESVKNGCEGFYLYYQPQVKIANYQLYGAEALLRYHSEIRGEVYPDEFIPLLEKSKLINQVGMWVLETALQQCRHWRETVEDFHISVNFSVVQLEEKHVAERVLDILAETGLPGNALTIEITESMQLPGNQEFDDIFRCWREAGIELSIDDFGTGYASMSYLKELDVSEIKIDRMFVQGVDEATYNYRLISNMIEFAKNNAIRVCCEGVEDMRELTVLEGLSPSLIQGYLFAKPCEREAFERTFIDRETEAYKENAEFIQKIYQYKDKMQVIYFDAKDILRETEVGLWIIRINEEEQYYEMHADETMEHVMAVDRRYTPQECYEFWYSRIKEECRDYVQKNIRRVMESDKVVQLQYSWIHPEFGEVIVRCSGKRVEDSDGMVTLEGYHRIISNIEVAVTD